MATATRKAKGTTKRRGPRKPVASRPAKPDNQSDWPPENGKAGQSNKFAPNQPPIDGMEDTDERVPELDEACQKYMSAKERKASAKGEQVEAEGDIARMIKEHGLNLYLFQGQKFYIEPGCESLKCVKAKQRGE